MAVQDAKEAGRSHIADLEGLTAAYLALGVRHTFGSDVAAEDTSYVSLDMLVGQRDRLSYQGRAMLALALAYEDVYATERDAIVATLTDALRIQGRTAYIARGEGAASSDMLASARLLAVQSILSRVGSSTGLPWDKLANGVASLGESTDARTSGYYFPVSRSAQDNTYALLSLATYDAAVGSDEPDATALVVLSSNSNRFVVVSEHFTSPADDPVTETISLATLAADARLRIAQASPPTSVVTDGPLVDASLEFGADGTAGELSFTVTMDYVPAALPTSPVYRGFTVTKVIRALDPLTGEPTGEPLTSARSGDQVVVTIDVHSPDDVADVLLVDPVPGCLEPVSADGAPQGASGGDDGGSRPWGWWWYQTWSLQEARADSVFAHSSWFRAGTHSLQYVALVVTPGTFVLPPTKVSAMLQPELLGLSAGGEFVATPVSASATQLLEAATAAAEAGDVRCFDEEPVPTLDDDFEEEKGDTFEGIGGRGDEPVDRADDESSSGDLSPGIVALLVILALVVVAAGSAAAYVLGRRRNRKRISSFVEDPVAARKVGGAGETGKGSAAGVTRRGASPSPSRAARHHRSSSRTRSGGASKHHRRPLIT
uniref:Bacterial alpha-2-macroglobulin MG10 domain-containing protein n=2 Tax=Sexangularia sp. CB-2014 TaxID=1486929 RepID=A0A7S1VVE9_9EUKA